MANTSFREIFSQSHLHLRPDDIPGSSSEAGHFFSIKEKVLAIKIQEPIFAARIKRTAGSSIG